MFCKNCGKEIEENASFCAYCGSAAGLQQVSSAIASKNEAGDVLPGKLVGTKSKRAYTVSIISAVISFIIRIAMQSKHIYWDTLVDNVKVMGIDREAKPFVTFIPVIAAVIAAVLISSDRETSAQNKKTVFIVNAAIIALALVFIWLDLPYQIFDF